MVCLGWSFVLQSCGANRPANLNKVDDAVDGSTHLPLVDGKHLVKIDDGLQAVCDGDDGTDVLTGFLM
jgi:hypothetical protein